jgi:hypothetical protein
LHNWEKPIKAALEARKVVSAGLGVQTAGIFSEQLPVQLTLEQVNIKAITGILSRASESLKSAQLNTIILNFELLVLGLLWYGMVSL